MRGLRINEGGGARAHVLLLLVYSGVRGVWD